MRPRSGTLDQLVEAELIYRRRGEPPEAVYEFKHALVQDAAYYSLLRSKRLQYHKRIGETLESGFAETVATKPELLAHHFREAGLPAKAFSMPCARARLRPRATRRPRCGALPGSASIWRTRAASRTPHAHRSSQKLASVAQNRTHYEADLKNLEQNARWPKD